MDTTLRGTGDGWIYEGVFSPQGDQVATCTWSEVHVWNPDNWNLNAVLEGLESAWITSLSWTPTGDTIAGSMSDMEHGTYEIWMWDAYSGEEINKIKGTEFWVEEVCFSPDGKKLVSSSGNMANDKGNLIIWGSSLGQPRQILARNDATIRTVDWSENSKLIACGETDDLIRIYDATDDHLIDSLAGHDYHVNKVRFSPDNKMLASTSMDKSRRVWALETMELEHVFSAHTSSTYWPAVSNKGLTITLCWHFLIIHNFGESDAASSVKRSFCHFPMHRGRHAG